MKVDPTATPEVLRKQLLAAIELADEVTLRKIASFLSKQSSDGMAKEPQVPYEPEVPKELRKPSDEELSRILKARADRNVTISSEEAFNRLRRDFG